MLYPVAIQQNQDVFHAHLPDIPELKINDKSMADTISTARQVVIDYLRQLVDEETPLPKASEINKLLADSKYAGWTWAIISIDINRVMGAQIELTVNIQQRLYAKINHQIEGQSIAMNDFIIDAIKQALI